MEPASTAPQEADPTDAAAAGLANVTVKDKKSKPKKDKPAKPNQQAQSADGGCRGCMLLGVVHCCRCHESMMMVTPLHQFRPPVQDSCCHCKVDVMYLLGYPAIIP